MTNPTPSFNEFLTSLREQGIIDVRLRISGVTEIGSVSFYVHPLDRNGQTCDYLVLKNNTVVYDKE